MDIKKKWIKELTNLDIREIKDLYRVEAKIVGQNKVRLNVWTKEKMDKNSPIDKYLIRHSYYIKHDKEHNIISVN